jgi:hypothetical protein
MEEKHQQEDKSKKEISKDFQPQTMPTARTEIQLSDLTP